MAAVMAEYATLTEPVSSAGGHLTLSRTFKVKNVDDKGRIIHIGHLEVTEEGLIFTYEHYPTEATRWPLTSIRRYGVNPQGDVFAFEVGRRAPTGEGTFAFRSDEAEEIQRLLDHYTNAQNKTEARSGGLAFSWRR